MTEHQCETEEIEVPAFLADPKVLAYLDGTDADLSRLVLEEDGMLWAYSKRDPGALCRCPLLDLVAVAFPAYATAPEPVAARSTLWAAEPPPTAKPKTRAKPTPLAIPKTGAARGLLASLKHGGDRRPWIVINGERQRCPKPAVDGVSVKVALVTEGTLTGFVVLDRGAFNLLGRSPDRLDTLMFNMLGGEVTTRVRREPGAPYAAPLAALLADLGSEARVTVMEAA